MISSSSKTGALNKRQIKAQIEMSSYLEIYRKKQVLIEGQSEMFCPIFMREHLAHV